MSSEFVPEPLSFKSSATAHGKEAHRNDQLGEQHQNETAKLLGKTLTRIIHDGGSRIAGPHGEACAKLVRIGYPLAQMGEDTHGVVARRRLSKSA